MATKLVNGIRVNLTAEEEAARDAEIATYNAGAKDRAMASLRSKRDGLLKDSDWEILKVLETGGTVTQAWKDYRQDLRDLPSTVADDDTAADVDAITFPTKP